LSEDKSRFRIRKGDIEIEYEGNSKEVALEFKNIFEWMKTIPEKLPEPTKEKKPEKKGGPRTGVIAPGVDTLIKEGFLDDFKNASEILDELRRKTVPVSDVNRVIMALNRRVPKTLDRIKDKEGRWVYRKKT